MTTITLTDGQQSALEAFTSFLMDPVQPVFVLSGYSGTGKTTLVKTLLEKLPNFIKTAQLLNPSLPDYEVVLTATTNKAAETLSAIAAKTATTIYSFLGLRVQTDYETNTTHLIPRNADQVEDHIIFIDEASYIDKQLLGMIFKKTKKCKIVFMGDPAQLTPVKSSATPVFDAQFPGARLTQVVRQADGNPIIDLATKFRHTVETGEFFSFTPDGQAVQYLEREAFNQAIVNEFTRPDWQYQDSKILGWTNKCVINYNHAVRDCVKGDPNFQVGDYAVCNKFITANRVSIKTDQLVHIANIEDGINRFGVDGKYYTLDGGLQFFGANSLAERNAALKYAKANEDWSIVEEIESRWIDLRAAYACTINKAQGSTFDRVFIDLDDIRRCNSGDQIARMLYVGVSRARFQVFLTGDLV